MDNFYDELIDFLCPNTRETWRPPLLPKYIQYHGRGEWKSSYPRFNVTYTVKLNPEFFKPKQIKQSPQMKQTKFNKSDMIAVTTPRGVTVAILAEDFTYEKPCMVECRSFLRHDGVLAVANENQNVELYIHQDCIDVRLANEQEGLRLFSAIRASGIEVPKVKEKKEEKKFAPSDGDFCYITDNDTVFISNGRFNSETGWPLFHCFISSHLESPRYSSISDVGLGFAKPRLATPSERQLLLDALAADGKKWNATEKRVENVLWRAKEGGRYFIPEFDTYLKEFKPKEYTEDLTAFDNSAYRIGIQFPSASDCQLLCDRLNAVIKANNEERIKIN